MTVTLIVTATTDAGIPPAPAIWTRPRCARDEPVRQAVAGPRVEQPDRRRWRRSRRRPTRLEVARDVGHEVRAPAPAAMNASLLAVGATDLSSSAGARPPLAPRPGRGSGRAWPGRTGARLGGIACAYGDGVAPPAATVRTGRGGPVPSGPSGGRDSRPVGGSRRRSSPWTDVVVTSSGGPRRHGSPGGAWSPGASGRSTGSPTPATAARSTSSSCRGSRRSRRRAARPSIGRVTRSRRWLGVDRLAVDIERT